MLCNEHLSKRLFAEVGINVPAGELVRPDDLMSYTPGVPGPWCAKTQVLSGGRGKAGGVVRFTDPAEAAVVCKRLFDLEINGEKPPCVRVESVISVEQELYLSFMMSRRAGGIVFTVSRGGGIEVESKSARPGGAFIQRLESTREGGALASCQIRAAFFHLFQDNDATLQQQVALRFETLTQQCMQAVQAYGLLLLEINPLALCRDGEWIALDAKVEIDDAILTITPALSRFHEPAHADPMEQRARQAGLAYLKLEGWVGLMANGAGLAMATMDVLNKAGLRAANFMDLGGGADKDRLAEAFRLVFEDQRVEVVFVNVFGGIVSCAAVAEAIVAALQRDAPPKPIIARLAGNGATEGQRLLAELEGHSVSIVDSICAAVNALRSMAPSGVDMPPLANDEEVGKVAVSITRSTDLVGEHTPSPSRANLGLHAGSRILVQGITGRAARHHVQLMQDYGTHIVAGVTPYKGGEKVHGVPVYNSINQAYNDQGAFDSTVIFVPAAAVVDSIIEAIYSNIQNIICITEGAPQAQMVYIRRLAAEAGVRLVGPNTPGLIIPGVIKLGIMPADVFSPGKVALLSRSGTLAYEAAYMLSSCGLGQSICIGVGGDPFVGLPFTDAFTLLKDDAETKAIVLIGEIGGAAEENFAEVVRASQYDKPIIALVAGLTAPPGKRLGHAGAILEESEGEASNKIKALREAGCWISPDLASLPNVVKAALAQCNIVL